jgi:hypothetical protein
MNDLDDPIIAALHRSINALSDMCNAHIKPWEPDSVWRAQNLFRELARPYIDAMCDYLATRPKSAFPVPWCNSVEDLVPVEYTEDYLD